MTTYESKIKVVAASAEAIYNRLTNLSQLKPMLERVAEMDQKIKIEDIEVTEDSISCTAPNFGKVGIRIVEREPNKTIKCQADPSPIEAYFWIQIIEKEPGDSRIKLTLKADIPIMLRAMVSGKLETGIDKMAEAIARINY